MKATMSRLPGFRSTLAHVMTTQTSLHASALIKINKNWHRLLQTADARGFWGQKSHDNYVAATFCSDHRQTRGRRATKPGTEPEETPRYNISACTVAATPNLRHTTARTCPRNPVQPPGAPQKGVTRQSSRPAAGSGHAKDQVGPWCRREHVKPRRQACLRAGDHGKRKAALGRDLSKKEVTARESQSLGRGGAAGQPPDHASPGGQAGTERPSSPRSQTSSESLAELRWPGDRLLPVPRRSGRCRLLARRRVLRIHIHAFGQRRRRRRGEFSHLYSRFPEPACTTDPERVWRSRHGIRVGIRL